MYNIYLGKKLVASFVRLKDARSHVNHVLVSEYSRKGFDLIALNFPRNGEPHKYTFGKLGVYHVVSISKD